MENAAEKGELWNVPHTNVRWPRSGWLAGWLAGRFFLFLSPYISERCRVFSPFQWRNNYDCVGSSIDFLKITIFVGLFFRVKNILVFCYVYTQTNVEQQQNR